MRQNSVLIDRGRGLRSDVAVLALEVKSGDAIFALFALERDAALDPFGCVTSRNSHGFTFRSRLPEHFRNTQSLAYPLAVLNVHFEAQSEKNQVTEVQ